MAKTTVRNGVDVDRLVQTIDAIKGDARAGKVAGRKDGHPWSGNVEPRS